MGPTLAHRLRTEAHAVWLAVRDPRTPMPARIFGVLVAAYALSPIDLIPDFIPVLGLVDDIVLVPIGVWLFAKMVPPALLAEHRARAEAETQRPVSVAGIAIVATLWIAAAWLAWSVAVWIFD